jgi:hypothetical protein
MFRKVAIVVVVALVASASYGAVRKQQEKRSLAKLFYAIGMVESGNNDNVKPGDQGKSHGRYQIQWAYWKDSGVPGSYRQVTNKAYAERVMIGYWKRHCPKALASCDYQTLARVHNGGPAGYRRSSTLPYWRKVQGHLK